MLHYVWAYAASFLFICFMIFFCQFVGKKISGNECFSLNLIYGFVCYTAIQGIGGIIIQILKLDYFYYQIYMVVIILALLIIKSDLKKMQIQVIYKNLIQHMKTYCPIYIMACILIFFSLINIAGLWNGNRQDDGWYLTQIEQLPQAGSSYTIHASTGFSYIPSFMRVVNTFEMEAAFYASTLNIPASIFVKVALAYFHYFLLGICVYEFSYKIFKAKNAVAVCAFVPLGILLFGLTTSMLRSNEFLVLTDDWQFNSAMGYGSSVVRTMGIFMFLPILDKKLFSIKTIIYIVATSVALMTKGTQALPIIYLVVAVLVILWVLENFKQKKRLIIMGIGFGVLLLFPAIGKDFSNNYQDVYSLFYANFPITYIPSSILLIFYLCMYLNIRWRKYVVPALPFVLIISLALGNVLITSCLMIIFGFTIENKYIKRWNLFLVLSAILIFVPKINTLFINFSVYDFVVKRTLTLYSVCFILTAIVYFAYYLLEKKVSLKKVSLTFIAFSVMITTYFLVNYQKTYSVIHALAVLKNNLELVPSSTIQLSERLDQLAVENGKQVNVVMPVHYTVNGLPHYPYIMLRLYSSNIRNVSAIARYGQEEAEQHDEVIRGFSFVEQTVIDQMNRSDVDVYSLIEGLDTILMTYPVIDTFVVTNPQFKDVLIKEFNYSLIDELSISDGGGVNYILYKDNGL